MIEKDNNIKKVRESNFELCRLICMLYIVVYHLIIHVPLVYETTIWGRPLRTLCHIGVIVFVMISGYFGIKRKWSGLLKLALSVSFYNLTGLAIACLCYGQPFELKSLLAIFFPITHGNYWFITSYAVLYLLAPYVNKVIQDMNKREFLSLIGILLVIVCYGGGLMDSKIGDGRGILAFILSYVIGNFIHKFYADGIEYPIVGNRSGIVYFTAATFLFCAIAFMPTLLSKAINFISFGYNEVGLYVMSVIFLLMFQGIKLKSKIINWLALSTLGIYLFHENKNIGQLVVYPLYEKLTTTINNEYLLLFVHIAFAIVILITAIIVDRIRQLIFVKVYK